MATKKELRRMGRKDLIELIYTMKKREEELNARLQAAEAKLAQKEIYLEKAGSIAEAALLIHGVFESAQAAADAYLQSLKVAGESHMGDEASK